jgi:hypothetical protein
MLSLVEKSGCKQSYIPNRSQPAPIKYSLLSIVSSIVKAIVAISKAFIYIISCCQKKSSAKLVPREHCKKPLSASVATTKKSPSRDLASGANKIKPSSEESCEKKKQEVAIDVKDDPLTSPETTSKIPVALDSIDISTEGDDVSEGSIQAEFKSMGEPVSLFLLKANVRENLGRYISINSIPLKDNLLNPSAPFDKDHVSLIIKEFNLNTSNKKEKIDEIPNILQPTAQLMNLVATQYRTKYGINIFVSNTSDFQSFIESKESNPAAYGIIITDDDDIGHVVPVLIINNGDIKQAIKLDAIGDPRELPITKKILTALQNSSFDIFSTEVARQVDYHSCRTEALTILRNMLLYIKKNRISNFNYFTQSCESHQMRAVGAIKIISIPGECDYIDQISRKDLGDLNSIKAIRAEFSSKETKLGKSESVLAFRDRYKRDVKFVSTYEPRKARLDISPYSMTFRIDTKKTISLSYDSGFKITEEVIKPINIYQTLKAYKYALKFTDNVLIPSFFKEFFGDRASTPSNFAKTRLS